MTTERDVQAKARLDASQSGSRLWRNNVGAVHTSDGRFVRFGLANESERQNRLIKSADLIGIKPVIITADMVGTTMGQFLSREIKSSNWILNRRDERTKAQIAWMNLINSLGGDAGFIVGEKLIFNL